MCTCMRAQSCLTLCTRLDCIPPGSLCSWVFPGKYTGVGSHALLHGIFLHPGSKLASPALAGRFFTTELPGKPNTCIAAAAAKSLQSCPTLCDPIDGSPPGSAIPGILLARTMEWVAISFSNACIRNV